MKTIISILIVSLLFFGCTKDGNGYRYMKVPAGKNHVRVTDAPPKIGFNKKSLQFSFRVTSNWLILDNGCVNKVGGLSQGDHKVSSCRLGVKAVGDELVFYMYTYVDGVRDYFPIDTCSFGTYYVDIGLVGDEWWMNFNGGLYSSPASQKKGLIPNYICRPFVGGDDDNVLDEDWIIWIKY